jgi:hypothetical protein
MWLVIIWLISFLSCIDENLSGNAVYVIQVLWMRFGKLDILILLGLVDGFTCLMGYYKSIYFIYNMNNDIYLYYEWKVKKNNLIKFVDHIYYVNGVIFIIQFVVPLFYNLVSYVRLFLILTPYLCYLISKY